MLVGEGIPQIPTHRQQNHFPWILTTFERIPGGDRHALRYQIRSRRKFATKPRAAPPSLPAGGASSARQAAPTQGAAGILQSSSHLIRVHNCDLRTASKWRKHLRQRFATFEGQCLTGFRTCCKATHSEIPELYFSEADLWIGTSSPQNCRSTLRTVISCSPYKIVGKSRSTFTQIDKARE